MRLSEEELAQLALALDDILGVTPRLDKLTRVSSMWRAAPDNVFNPTIKSWWVEFQYGRFVVTQQTCCGEEYISTKFETEGSDGRAG